MAASALRADSTLSPTLPIPNIKVVKFLPLKTFLLLRYLYMTQEVKMIFLCKQF